MKKQPTARAGKKLGRYRIERELGRGGMGVVYLAADENLGRLVALKTTSVAGLGGGNNARTQRRQRFIREVQALSNVNHPNVVHVFDSGEEDDPDLGWLLFYSMEHVDGLTLSQLVQQFGPLAPGAAAAVCMQVAAGLGAAHERGIVHRDVKPANIFVSKDGRALIGDFGICKIEGSTQITRRDQLVGTPNYLAPEQILGEDVSAATDVFALGALFYVVAVNRPLRDRVDPASLLQSAQSDDPKRKILAEARIPDGLAKVVARALERDPKKRWADGNHFADALAEHATRVPPLDRPDDDEAFLRDTSSGDSSSPFRDMPRPEAGSVNDVEAAARALLSEVDEDEAAPPPRPAAPKAPAPLPVARTESTVMFNLRNMEDKAKKPAAPPPPPSAPPAIPVARTESTVVYKMREEQGAPPQAQQQRAPTLAPFYGDDDGEGDEPELSPLSSPGLPRAAMRPAAASYDAAGFESDERTLPGEATSDHADVEPPTRVLQPDLRGLAAPRARTTPFAFDWRRFDPRALPPDKRLLFLGVCAGGGALLGVLALFVVAALVRAPAPPPPVELPIVPLVADAPAECAIGAKSDGDRLQAKFKVGLALRAKQDNKEADALAQLDEALRLDPRNVQGHYERARLRATMQDIAGAKLAYKCVCAIDPSTAECAKATKALASTEPAAPK